MNYVTLVFGSLKHGQKYPQVAKDSRLCTVVSKERAKAAHPSGHQNNHEEQNVLGGFDTPIGCHQILPKAIFETNLWNLSSKPSWKLFDGVLGEREQDWCAF